MLNKFTVVTDDVFKHISYDKETGKFYRIVGEETKLITANYFLIEGKRYSKARVAYYANYKENPPTPVYIKEKNKLHVRDNLLKGSPPRISRIRARETGLPKGIYYTRSPVGNHKFNVTVYLHKLVHVGNYKTLEDAINARDFAQNNSSLYIVV